MLGFVFNIAINMEVERELSLNNHIITNVKLNLS